jgi:hypothetical protein
MTLVRAAMIVEQRIMAIVVGYGSRLRRGGNECKSLVPSLYSDRRGEKRDRLLREFNDIGLQFLLFRIMDTVEYDIDCCAISKSLGLPFSSLE